MSCFYIYLEELHQPIANREGIDLADNFNKIYTPDYSIFHSFLDACADSNADTPVKTFETAVFMLNDRRSPNDINVLLIKVNRFKMLLPVEPKTKICYATSSKATDGEETSRKRTDSISITTKEAED